MSHEETLRKLALQVRNGTRPQLHTARELVAIASSPPTSLIP